MFDFLFILLRLARFALQLLATEVFLPFLRKQRQKILGGFTANTRGEPSPSSSSFPSISMEQSDLGTDELLAWQLTDYPEHDAIINLVAHFEGVLDLSLVEQQVTEFVAPHMRMHSIPTFMSSSTSSSSLPTTQADLNQPCQPIHWRRTARTAPSGKTLLDMGYHLKERTFDTGAQMESYVQSRANHPSELRSVVHPWWDLHLMHVQEEQQEEEEMPVGNSKMKKNKSSKKCHVLFRVHHAVGDGISLVQALGPGLVNAEGEAADLTSLFKPRRSSPMPKTDNIPVAGDSVSEGCNTTTSSSSCNSKVAHPHISFFSPLIVEKIIFPWALWLLWTLPWLVIDTILCIKADVGTMAEPADTTTSFHDGSSSFPPQFQHRMAWLPRYSVNHCKQLKERLNDELRRERASAQAVWGMPKGTSFLGRSTSSTSSDDLYSLNDIQYALYAGAIRRYNMRVSDSGGCGGCGGLEKVHMRSFSPVALPPRNGEHLHQVGTPGFYQSVLRNYWVLVKTTLPVQEATALDRVKASHKSWSDVKSSMAIPVGYFLSRFNAVHMTLRQLRDLNRKLGSEVTLMFSNLPGPAEPLFTRCGRGRLTGLHAVFPNFPSQTIIVSVDGYFNICAMVQKLKRSAKEQQQPGGGGDQEEEDGDLIKIEEELLSRCYVEELQELCLSVGLVETGEEVLQYLKPKY